MWIIPRQLHTWNGALATAEFISDSAELSETCASSLLVRSKVVGYFEFQTVKNEVARVRPRRHGAACLNAQAGGKTCCKPQPGSLRKRQVSRPLNFRANQKIQRPLPSGDSGDSRAAWRAPNHYRRRCALKLPKRPLRRGGHRRSKAALTTRPPMPINVFHIAKDLGPVGQGVSDAFRALVPAIVKTNDQIDTCVANEYIANGIGRFLGLPLAPGAIVGISPTSNTFGYATLQFNLTSEALPDIDPPLLVQKLPREATGVVVFDILIANPDRHVGNLSALLHADKPKLLVFDHSHAILGYDRGEAMKRFVELENRLGISGGTITGQNRHCLIDVISDESLFGEWISRVRAIPNFILDDICNEMRDVNFINDAEAVKLRTFLRHRRDRLPELIRDNKGEFNGIKQWGLLPW